MGALDVPGVPYAATRNPGEFYGVAEDGKATGLSDVLDYAEDTTGFPLPLVNGAAVYPLGVVVCVEPASYAQVLRGYMPFQVTVAGNGSLLVSIWEITTATPVFLDADGPSGAFLAGTWSAFQSGRVEVELGVVTTPRQFALAGLLERDTSSSLAGSIRSLVGGNPRSKLKVVRI